MSAPEPNPLDDLAKLLGDTDEASARMLAETQAKVNEDIVVRMVHEGKMPVAILDHLGHTKHNIFSPSCEYCAKPAKPIEVTR